MGEAGKLKQHEEDELGGEVLPQQLARPSDVGVKVFLGLRALHGVHHQVHQLLLQHRAPLLLLVGEWGVLKGEERGDMGRRLNRNSSNFYTKLLKGFKLLPLLQTDFFYSLACRTASPSCLCHLVYCSSNPAFILICSF